MLSTAELYAGLEALPKSGAGSLAALYTTLGAMDFAAFYKYLSAAADDASLVVDGRAAFNPKHLLAAQQGAFQQLGEAYPTVGAWWDATGSKPALPTSYAAYKDELDALLPNPTLGLLPGSMATICPVVLARTPRGRIAYPARGMTLTQARRQSAASQGNQAAASALNRAAVQSALTAARNGRSYSQTLYDQYLTAQENGSQDGFMRELTTASQARTLIDNGEPLSLPGWRWVDGTGEESPLPHEDAEPDPDDPYLHGGYVRTSGQWSSSDGYCPLD